MKSFGQLLRTYRRQCRDPVRGGQLTQERLGELIGVELGDAGYSGAAVSDWERNKSKINEDDRLVLVSLITVLHNCGGIQTPDEANRLLQTANYRALDNDEVRRVNVNWLEESSPGTRSLIDETSNLIRSKFGAINDLSDLDSPLPPAKNGAFTSLYNAFDYVLSMEYNAILLRRFHPVEYSYVSSQLFDGKGELSSIKPLVLLDKDLLELHEASIGQHTNQGMTTIKENVRVEVCDCLFRLMVLDVSLGGENRTDIAWAAEFVEGMEFVRSLSKEEMQQIILELNALSLNAPEQARQRIPPILWYLGMVASTNELTLPDIIGEIQRRYRWSGKAKDMGKRLTDLVYAVNGKPVPREQWLSFDNDLPIFAKMTITTIKKLLNVKQALF